ncbi:response regulator transcription factor [Brevibacillus fluminis]|uniref:response regulator transcription factor n=1 Tax=Brevibacillus fluminis TaxID=511487 RepID=UPI003F88C343
MRRGIYVDGQANTYKRLREQFKVHSLHLLKERGSASRSEVVFIIIDSQGATSAPMVIRYRRAYPHASIVVLTNSRDEQDLVNALAFGADDYQVKPCSERELATRIRVILKRKEAARHVPGPYIHLDMEARSFEWGGYSLQLTRIESKLLELLVKSQKKITSREQIIHSVWDNRIQATSKVIDVHICNLRKKLGEASNGQLWIKTVTNKGFYLSGSDMKGD